jgi:response regulator RpfG family c-di-GMP phosphodiesterase
MAVDVSMPKLMVNEVVFITQLLSLFLGFYALILSVSIAMAREYLIKPINAMASATGEFAYNSEAARGDSVERIRSMDIHTGDEIENLYRALTKTVEDTAAYISEVSEKNRAINHLQNGLILVMADLVESRDKCTGDHIKNTAAYVQIIIDQMRREGIYSEAITDQFAEDVVNSAPLHDIGKIQVPDAILNKPGKLTAEEFADMKEHTTHGGSIIADAIEQLGAGDSGYLREAKNLALCHHEKWDGSGYPNGLKGEEIPLSARIMAVADVFDALVSKRSYKEGMPFEKAMSIIREGSGSHFDPLVVQAFVDAEDQVRKVSAEKKAHTH